MTDADFERLRIALLALLPKDGTPVTVTQLAQDTGAAKSQVTDALFPDYMAGAVDFDVRADAFSARKTGGALPGQPTNRITS